MAKVGDQRHGVRVGVDEVVMPLMAVDEEGRVVDVNDPALGVLAASREDVRDTPLLRWVPDRSKGLWRRRCIDVLEGESRSWTGTLRRLDGNELTRRVEALPRRAEPEEETGGMLLFLHPKDWSCRSRPEAVQLLDLLENLPGRFVVVLDREGRIRRAVGTRGTHHRNPGDLTALPYTELLADVDGGEDPEEAMRRGLEQRGRWVGSQLHLRSDGEAFPVRISAVPFRGQAGEGDLGTLVSGEDMSEVVERARVRRVLRPAAILGDATSRILRMLPDSSIWDDVRGNGKPRKGPPPATLFESLRRFPDPGRRIRRKVRPSEVVEEGVASYGRSGGGNGRTEVRLEVADDCPPVEASRDDLLTLVEVLLENAAASAAEVDGGRVRVIVDHDPEAVFICVENDTPPLPARVVERAFEPLFSTRDDGTGLGLTAALAVVEAHGGRIWIETPAETRFAVWVELPHAGRGPSLKRVTELLADSRSRRVLVVDDEKDVRLTLTRFLERVGCEVRQAWSGRSALAELTSGALPDVVVTDLRMEEGSGYWFLDRLERDFPELIGRTVIITANADRREARELSARTGCPLLSKPFDLHELLQMIERADLQMGPLSPA